MSRQVWTAIVSAVLFVALAAALAFVPVPYVVWSPGGAVDLLQTGTAAPITVRGATSYPTTGRLLLTTVNVTKPESRVSLGEALHAYWSPDREALPYSAVYPAGASAAEVDADEVRLMDDSQEQATAAALSAAGLKVTRVPVVASVSSTGPAQELRPRDVIAAVDGVALNSASEVESAVADREIGKPVVFTVIRDGKKLPQPITVITVAHQTEKDFAVAGARFTNGFSFDTDVAFTIDPDIGGSSAGLAFGLALYDKVTPGALMGDRVVAATGTLDSDGRVGAVGGVREKVLSAEQAGASVLLLPSANCADAASLDTEVRLLPVATLSDALSVLGALSEPATATSVKGCP